MKNFFDYYFEHAEKNPNKVLLRIDNESLTYGEFVDKTAEIASGMKKLNIKKNDKIGIIMPNSIEWYLIFWSAVRIGAQPVPLDPQSGEFELVKICFAAEKYRNNPIIEVLKKIIPEKITINKIICFTENSSDIFDDIFISSKQFQEDFCQDTCDTYIPENEHIMSLACTSGSTGNPKILSVPYYGFLKAAEDMGSYLEFSENEVMMIGMTLYHQGGFGMGLQTTVKGGTVIYQPQFNPITFLETVQKYKVTVIQLTSTLAKVLLSAPGCLAGAGLSKDLADVFANQLGIRVINIIGSFETATMVVWDSDCDFDCDPSDFRKLPFTDFKVLGADMHEVEENEIGELCIFTDAVITDYIGNPQLSNEK